MTQDFKDRIRSQGYKIYNCPYTPIHKEWEGFPIVKAIRQIEKSTGEAYTHNKGREIK